LSDAEVHLDGKLVGKGKTVPAKLKRDFKIKQFRIEAPGYKPQYVTALQKSPSPLVIMSWIPFGLFFLLPPLMDNGPKSKDYDKKFTIQPMLKTSARNANEKYIYLKNTSFEVKKEDMVIERYKLPRVS
jgi:serine protease Do